MTKFQIIDLPSFDILSEMHKMINDGKISWESGNQICLTTTKDGPDDPYYGTGSLGMNWAEAVETVDQNGNLTYTVPDRPELLSEFDYNRLCSVFKGTMFEEVYNMLSDRYRIGRIRLMSLNPKTCLTWHFDFSPRLHYPIKTTEQNFMVIEDEVKHLEQDKWWRTDTTKYHTVFNGGFETRIHLVAVIEEK
jgi:hypothetical protein